MAKIKKRRLKRLSKEQLKIYNKIKELEAEKEFYEILLDL